MATLAERRTNVVFMMGSKLLLDGRLHRLDPMVEYGGT
jgi:hypothetical protein